MSRRSYRPEAEIDRHDRCAPRSFVYEGVPEHIVPRMARSSSPRPCRYGLPLSGRTTAYITPAVDGEWLHRVFFSTRVCAMESLDGEIFIRSPRPRSSSKAWWRHYNAVSPMDRFGLQTAGTEVFVPAMTARAAAIPASDAARASIDAVNARTFKVDPSVGAYQRANATAPRRVT